MAKMALSRKKIFKYIPYIIIFLSFIVLFIRSFYSFCWSDETFYLATACRFYKGDSVFLHDWFPTQLSGVFILPLYSLFVIITGGTTGIVLFFRIVYSFFELILGIILFRLIKNIHGSITALVISLISMFYTHLNIATISYYTMSVTFFLLAMTLLYSFYMTDSVNDSPGDAKKTKNGIKKLIAAGVCFAISVLNIPTMAVAYILIAAGGFILHFAAKLMKSKKIPVIDSLKLPVIFKYTLIGIIIPAVIFMIYLLSNVSITDFIKSIPYVLSDDEHITSKLYPIRKMYLAIIESYGNRIFYLGCLINAAAVVSWIIKCFTDIIRQNKSRDVEIVDKILKILNAAIVITDMALFLLYSIKSFGHTGYMQTAIMMFAVPLFFITDKKDIFAFILFFLSGITFSLVYSYSSNGMLYVLSIGHFIASVGGIIFIKEFIIECNGLIQQENADLKCRIYIKSVSYVMVLFVLSALIHTAACRIVNIYRDDKLSVLTSVITEGPAKWLHTNAKHKEMYDEVYGVITKYCQTDDTGNLLISFLLPWGYLCTDSNVAAPTTWRNGMDSERLRQYYEINPDKRPDTILVLNEYYGTYETCGDVEFDPSPNANASEGFMYEYIENEGFEKTNVICGALYKKRK